MPTALDLAALVAALVTTARDTILVMAVLMVVTAANLKEVPAIAPDMVRDHQRHALGMVRSTQAVAAVAQLIAAAVALADLAAVAQEAKAAQMEQTAPAEALVAVVATHQTVLLIAVRAALALSASDGKEGICYRNTQ